MNGKRDLSPTTVQAWWLAARPKTLAGALLPILIGCSLAVMQGYFQVRPALICVLFATLMQVAANFINDLYDYLKGTDREDRLGPKRACAQGWITPRAMRIGIAFTLSAACLIGCLLLPYGGWPLFGVGITCVVFAFLYTVYFSYRGWGDVLVLLFFGFVPVCGTYYMQSGTLADTNVWLAALASGLVVDTLLVVNNYRDREADRISGKRTLVVRFGERFGSGLYLGLGVVASLLFAWVIYNPADVYLTVLPLLYLFGHTKTWRKMEQIHTGKALNLLIGETSRNMLVFGALVVFVVCFRLLKDWFTTVVLA